MTRTTSDPDGPDGAPRDDGLDARWSSDYRAIVSLHPELREYALGLCSLSWDQGARQHAAGRRNPFWGLDTEAADAAQQPKEHAMPETKPPVEAKVYAATGGAGAGFVIGNAVTWGLGVFVWGAASDAANAANALAAVPHPVGELVTLGVTVVGAYWAGYRAKHTFRSDAEARA